MRSKRTRVNEVPPIGGQAHRHHVANWAEVNGHHPIGVLPGNRFLRRFDRLLVPGSFLILPVLGVFKAPSAIIHKDFPLRQHKWPSHGRAAGSLSNRLKATGRTTYTVLVHDVQGGFTRDFLAGGEQTTIYDASVGYAKAGVPLIVLAGKEYGSGSSRDWAAKGTSLLGVRAVIAESFERIHRSNLIGMGVLPLQFPQDQSASSLGLDGTETFAIAGVTALNDGDTPSTMRVTATRDGADPVEFDAVVRIDTPGEADYYRNGGIMQYVLRKMVRG